VWIDLHGLRFEVRLADFASRVRVVFVRRVASRLGSLRVSRTSVLTRFAASRFGDADALAACAIVDPATSRASPAARTAVQRTGPR
jgi:hypothetical protein